MLADAPGFPIRPEWANTVGAPEVAIESLISVGSRCWIDTITICSDFCRVARGRSAGKSPRAFELGVPVGGKGHRAVVALLVGLELGPRSAALPLVEVVPLGERTGAFP